jgi:quinol monooxygenase YgiN
MYASFRRLFTITAIFLLSAATAGAGDNAGHSRPRVRGPIFDITHFDVIPLTENGVDFEQTAYKALFEYRDASRLDPGFESIRVVNWLLASNHSQIIDVWRSLDAFEAHLAQQHSVDFRFAVQVQPPPPPPGFNCCIGSPIDDRQYSQVISFNMPWTSSSLPSGVGTNKSALFVVTYVDFLLNGDPVKGRDDLVRYGSDTSKASGQLSYTVLQQIDRSNRFAALEVWDSETDYNAWQNDLKTTKFFAKVMPLLGSPFDHRLNILCGKTYVDGTGCVAP